MGSLFHVARTYWRRPRFWIFGGWYAFITLVPSWHMKRPDAVTILFLTAITAVFGSLVAAFVALHVRRQFGTPQAHLTPGFAWPHLLVAALATLAIWVAVPWIMAWRAGVPPVVLISLHAFVALVAAAVVLWPKISILLAVAPLLLIWPALVMDRNPSGRAVEKSAAQAFAEDFVVGRTAIAYAGLLALAAACYPLAAWRLLWLSDVAVATSDDFTIEPPGTALTSTPLTGVLQTWRDRRVEWQLARPPRWCAAIQRRRIPSAPPWAQMASVAALVLVAMAPAWWVEGGPHGAWFVLEGGTVLMLFTPYSFWRFRTAALATEVMRPATRVSAVREVMLAMAGDFLAWAVAATITLVLGSLVLLTHREFDGWRTGVVALYNISFLWCLGVWTLGIALTTLRLRYWMPMFAALLIGSVVGLVALNSAVLVLAGAVPFLDVAPLILFPGGFLAIGLALAALAYRRWRQMDIA